MPLFINKSCWRLDFGSGQERKSGFIPEFAYSTDAPRSLKTDPFIDSLENAVIEVFVVNLLLTQSRKAAKVKNYN